jgi:hypothetical protein
MKDSLGTAEDVMVTGREFMPSTDEAFIYSTWRNGFFYGALNKEELPPAEEFFKEKTAEIKRILEGPSTKVRIACIKDAPEVILGYAVFTGDLHLEWIFVKQQFRGKKIAKFLTVNLKSVTANLTKSGAAITKKKNLSIKRSPYETF